MLEYLFELKPVKYGIYSELEMVEYLVGEGGYQYFIYGAGECGRLLYDWCDKIYGLKPAFFVDRSPEHKSYSHINHAAILSLDEFRQMSAGGGQKRVAVVSTMYYNDAEERKKIDQFLKENHVDFIVDGTCVLGAFKVDWYNYMKANLRKFEDTCRLLADDVSRDTFCSYLRTYITGERYSGSTFLEEYKYWGIDNAEYRMFNLTDKEVWLNLGAACGDTIFQYLKCGNPFQKIIAVEPERCERLNLAVSCLKESVRKKIQMDKVFLGVDCGIDELYENENISLINMDIEGAELAALNSGIKTIRRCRPVLSVCVYHKKDDLIKIPEFVVQNLEDYVLTLRKYPSQYFDYIDGIQQINELVLYAIPKERYIPHHE